MPAVEALRQIATRATVIVIAPDSDAATQRVPFATQVVVEHCRSRCPDASRPSSRAVTEVAGPVASPARSTASVGAADSTAPRPLATIHIHAIPATRTPSAPVARTRSWRSPQRRKEQ